MRYLGGGGKCLYVCTCTYIITGQVVQYDIQAMFSPTCPSRTRAEKEMTPYDTRALIDDLFILLIALWWPGGWKVWGAKISGLS